MSEVAEVRVSGPKRRVRGTHLGGQMHEQHSSHRALGLAVALFRPIEGVGLEYLQEPLLPVPEDPIRHPFPNLRQPLPRPHHPGLAGSPEMPDLTLGEQGWGWGGGSTKSLGL